MKRSIYLDTSPGERRGVVLLDGKPERLLVERDADPERPRIGEMWRGRVGSYAPAFRAAFVELGAGQAALLPREAGEPVIEGAILEVEVLAEARSGKGPVVRMVRPASGPPGRLTAQPDLPTQLQGLAPGATLRSGWEARHVADLAEEQCLAVEHLQPGGLNLSVEQTRGLVAIDVDWSGARAGKHSILEANRRALLEAARLLRLKGTGGLVIVDLIGKASEHASILAAAKAAFEPDQPGVVFGGLSRFGVLELAKPWRETPLAERLLDDGGAPSTETLAHRVTRDLERAGRADPGAMLVAVCHPGVAAAAEPLVKALGPRFGVRAEAGKSRLDADIRTA
ncbi:MAG: ribonuclease E/G [Caulobacteraceae bacterium]|nr:ribonuclease E/G [Caulobacteraceae bacterium]